jgi:glucose-6-phosphate isomerase
MQNAITEYNFARRLRMAIQQQEKNPPNFLNYAATKKLAKLAEHPFDLNQLIPERIAKFYGEACGFKLLYGTERITDDVMQALKELAQESHAIEKMERMQAGDVVNYITNHPSENRAALHTATRDFFDHPNPAKAAQAATKEALQEIEKLKKFIASIGNRFNTLVMIGIGGSDLGPQANYFALEQFLQPGRKVFFISNVDPDNAAAVLQQVDLKHTLVVVVSKSGKTLETHINEEFAREKFKTAGLDPKKSFVSVTTPGSPMDNPSDYLESFYVWEWVGGRYSTTSMVGGVMLAFAFGFDVFWEFLRGANAMDKVALKNDLKQNLPLLAALLGIWNRNFLNYPTVALIPYSQVLKRYPAHIQQVAMESNGKLIDQAGNLVAFETGPVIWGEPGTNAQHSFFQLIHQGTSTIPVSMVGFKESQYQDDIVVEGTTSQEKLLSNLFAQSIALATGQKSDNPNQYFPGNRPTNILIGKRLTPYALGALLAFYENLVDFQGFIWGINSFDQEGVQLGKVLATKIIDLFTNRKTENTSTFPLGSAFLTHLETLE